MQLFASLTQLTVEQATALFAVNFFGAYLISKYAGPVLRSRGRSRG
jgi:NAD(P)-dependent dehydrogenase (short-subunit alcohol dehydrogenase family)